MSKKQTSGKEIRLALIPHPGCVCEQCLEVASFGFHYTHEVNPHKTKNINCKCRFMPGVDGETEVDGYDKDECRRLLEKSRRIRKSLKADQDQIKEFFAHYGVTDIGAVEEEILAETWRKCSFACSSEDFTDVLQESKRRSPSWVMLGTPERFEILDGAKPTDFEIRTAESLGNNGMKSKFRKPSNDEGVRTSDVFLQDVPFEFKAPTGAGKQTIYHQLEEAAGQSSYLVIDLARTEISFDDAVQKVEKIINYHYAVKDNKVMQYDEVLIVGYGKLKRIKRKK